MMFCSQVKQNLSRRPPHFPPTADSWSLIRPRPSSIVSSDSLLSSTVTVETGSPPAGGHGSSTWKHQTRFTEHLFGCGPVARKFRVLPSAGPSRSAPPSGLASPSRIPGPPSSSGPSAEGGRLNTNTGSEPDSSRLKHVSLSRKSFNCGDRTRAELHRVKLTLITESFCPPCWTEKRAEHQSVPHLMMSQTTKVNEIIN